MTDKVYEEYKKSDVVKYHTTPPHLRGKEKNFRL